MKADTIKADIVRTIAAELLGDYETDARFRAAMEPLGGAEAIPRVAELLGDAIEVSVEQLVDSFALRLAAALSRSIVRKATQEAEEAHRARGEQAVRAADPAGPTA